MQEQQPPGAAAPGPTVGTDPVAAPAPGATAAAYLEEVARILARVAAQESATLTEAAGLIADRLAAGGIIHAFGTGHSHMLAEELFYRAGGLAQVDPLLVDDLMLHRSASASTSLERAPALAAQLLAEHPMGPGDVLVAASNSGGTRVTVELAQLARAAGVLVIAVTSVNHARSSAARTVEGPRLHEVADVVLDTHGAPGDAAVAVPGLARRVGPTSTVVGAALLQALASEVAAALVARGVEPDVFSSSNTADGDAINDALVARYRDRVRTL
jgi:uncharacterized phosphosugar-binding protein